MREVPLKLDFTTTSDLDRLISEYIFFIQLILLLLRPECDL